MELPIGCEGRGERGDAVKGKRALFERPLGRRQRLKSGLEHETYADARAKRRSEEAAVNVWRPRDRCKGLLEVWIGDSEALVVVLVNESGPPCIGNVERVESH